MTYKRVYFFRLFSVLFFLTVAVPGALTLSGAEQRWLEKRRPATFPELPVDLESLRQFPAQFEKYFQDHIGFRYYFNKGYSQALVSINTSPVAKKVILGKNDWLFFIADGALDDYRNTALFTQKQLRIWAASLETRQQVLAKKGIDYLFVIAPNKHTIYSEYIPDYIVKKQERSRCDQLVEYLQKHTQVNFLDLRPVLLKAKQTHLLYWQKDTHWNRVGATVAQQALLAVLKNMGYRSNALDKLIDYPSWTHTYTKDQDLARLLGGVYTVKGQGASYDTDGLLCQNSSQENQFWGANKHRETHVRISHCFSQRHKAVMFRDSFSIELMPFLSNYFLQIKYIWGLPDESTFWHFIPPDTDIVIEQRIERSLRNLPSPWKWSKI